MLSGFVDRKKYLVISILVLSLAVIGSGAVLIYRHGQKPVGLQKTSTGYEVNLSPPTEEEKKETQQKKQQVAEDQAKEPDSSNTPPVSSDKATKTPFIVFVGQEGQTIELTGYVPGIFEEGGTCTATFMKASLRVTRQSKAFKDYNYTSCTPISIDRSAFQEAGDWQVTLSYESTSTTGVSKASTIVVK